MAALTDQRTQRHDTRAIAVMELQQRSGLRIGLAHRFEGLDAGGDVARFVARGDAALIDAQPIGVARIETAPDEPYTILLGKPPAAVIMSANFLTDLAIEREITPAQHATALGEHSGVGVQTRVPVTAASTAKRRSTTASGSGKTRELMRWITIDSTLLPASPRITSASVGAAVAIPLEAAIDPGAPVVGVLA